MQELFLFIFYAFSARFLRKNYFSSFISLLPSCLTSLFCARFLSRRCFHHSTVLTPPFDLLEEAIATSVSVRLFLLIREGGCRRWHGEPVEVTHLQAIVRNFFWFFCFHDRKVLDKFGGIKAPLGIPRVLHHLLKFAP